jgi:hypothetical protein
MSGALAPARALAFRTPFPNRLALEVTRVVPNLARRRRTFAKHELVHGLTRHRNIIECREHVLRDLQQVVVTKPTNLGN